MCLNLSQSNCSVFITFKPKMSNLVSLMTAKRYRRASANSCSLRRRCYGDSTQYYKFPITPKRMFKITFMGKDYVGQRNSQYQFHQDGIRSNFSQVQSLFRKFIQVHVLVVQLFRISLLHSTNPSF